MTVFGPLLRELDAWAEQGRSAELWWRDDDASDASNPLETMLGIAAEASVPLALAVIPMAATSELVAALSGRLGIAVWQHGIRHTDIATRPAKKQELVAANPETLAGLLDGWDRLHGLFGELSQPVLVPPWNRIGPGLVLALPGLGYRGLSAFKPRQTPMPAPGLVQINTHVDLLDWRAGAVFRGTETCIAAIARQIEAKRRGLADRREPTGILSHHLVMQANAWDFLSRLFAVTKAHPGCNWILPDFSVSRPEPE